MRDPATANSVQLAKLDLYTPLDQPSQPTPSLLGSVCKLQTAARAAEEEAGPGSAVWESVGTLLRVLSNIAQNPAESKHRTLRIENAKIKAMLSGHDEVLNLLRITGTVLSAAHLALYYLRNMCGLNLLSNTRIQTLTQLLADLVVQCEHNLILPSKRPGQVHGDMSAQRDSSPSAGFRDSQLPRQGKQPPEAALTLDTTDSTAQAVMHALTLLQSPLPADLIQPEDTAPPALGLQEKQAKLGELQQLNAQVVNSSDTLSADQVAVSAASGDVQVTFDASDSPVQMTDVDGATEAGGAAAKEARVAEAGSQPLPETPGLPPDLRAGAHDCDLT